VNTISPQYYNSSMRDYRNANDGNLLFDAVRFKRPTRTSILRIVPVGNFNLIARNQDDQVENIAILMDKFWRWARAGCLNALCIPT
jgi:hypothetical protein